MAGARLGLPSLFLDGAYGLQLGQDLIHGRPAPGVTIQALEDQLGRLRCPFHGVPALEPRVHYLPLHPLVGEQRLGPLYQVVLEWGPGRVQRLQASQHLQQHHAEPVHIALHVQMPW